MKVVHYKQLEKVKESLSIGKLRSRLKKLEARVKVLEEKVNTNLTDKEKRDGVSNQRTNS